MPTLCKCGRKQLSPVGPDAAKILIIGECPEDEDMKANMPFVGKRGNVLYNELSRVGLEMQKVRLTFFSLHPLASDCSGHMMEMLLEMKNKDGVLVMGSTACQALGIERVSDHCGLVIHSPFIPHSTGFVMATVLPPSTDFVGEFRLSIEKFAKKLKEMKNG